MTEILPHLFLGGLVSTEPEFLIANNIRAIVSCCNEYDFGEPLMQMPQFRVPVEDISNEPISDYMDEACHFIHSQIDAGSKVLIHCRSGVSRSATIVIAYLMKFMGMSLNDSFMMVIARRSCICPNIGFMKQLCMFEESLLINAEYERGMMGHQQPTLNAPRQRLHYPGLPEKTVSLPSLISSPSVDGSLYRVPSESDADRLYWSCANVSDNELASQQHRRQRQLSRLCGCSAYNKDTTRTVQVGEKGSVERQRSGCSLCEKFPSTNVMASQQGAASSNGLLFEDHTFSNVRAPDRPWPSGVAGEAPAILSPQSLSSTSSRDGTSAKEIERLRNMGQALMASQYSSAYSIYSSELGPFTEAPAESRVIQATSPNFLQPGRSRRRHCSGSVTLPQLSVLPSSLSAASSSATVAATFERCSPLGNRSDESCCDVSSMVKYAGEEVTSLVPITTQRVESVSHFSPIRSCDLPRASISLSSSPAREYLTPRNAMSCVNSPNNFIHSLAAKSPSLSMSKYINWYTMSEDREAAPSLAP